MALIWADFPSGQLGLYGTNTWKMMNGVWAEATDADGPVVELVNDPDPSIGALGVVMKVTGDDGIFDTIRGARFAYPSPQQTQGVGFRLWMDKLPTNQRSPTVAFKDASNNVMFAFHVLTTGAVEFRTQAGSGGTQLAATSGPVLVANAYNHIEMKVFSHASAGTIELRVNGAVKISATGLNTDGDPIAQVHIGQTNSTSGCVGYYKDIVFWDTTGSEVNNFQGAVAVYDIVPDADVSSGWSPSNGSAQWSLVNDALPANTLTSTGAVADGNVIRIDNTYYRFSTGSLDTGSPAGTSGNPWKVLIGGTVADSLSNLFKAIGATGVAGTDYSTALTAHTTVDPDGLTATQLSVSAKLANASAIVVTCSGNFNWEDCGFNITTSQSSTLLNGPTDPSYIAADSTLPAPAIFTMTDLPPDVISVRGVIPIGRLVKSDGGDCDVQMSVSPDATNWDDGADRPITTASTFWWDVSHLSPATSAAWTPSEVNSMRFRIDRTL